MLECDAVWLGKWQFVVSFGCPSVTEPFLSTSGCCWQGTGGYTRFRVCWHVTPCGWVNGNSLLVLGVRLLLSHFLVLLGVAGREQGVIRGLECAGM